MATQVPNGIHEMNLLIRRMQGARDMEVKFVDYAVIELLSEVRWRMQQMVIQDMDDSRAESEAYNNAIDDCCETVEQMIKEWQTR